MERIAIISDIHSNLEALKSVLEDIKKRNINRVFCLGDIIHKGVNHHECIKLVQDNCEIVLKGNCDQQFSKEHDLSTVSEIERKRILWNQEILSREERDYLQSLPFCHEFYLSGSLVRLFHACP